MYSSLQKKSFFVFLVAIVILVFTLGLNFLGSKLQNEPRKNAVEDFYAFESAYLALKDEEQKANNGEFSANSFSLASEQESTYSLKRLIVVGELKNSYGATTVIVGYKDYSFLCYETEEQTAYAYQMLSKDEDLIVVVDSVITLEDYADEEYQYDNQYVTWGRETMNVGGINDYLSTYGTDEEVVVVVIDSGIRPTHMYFEDRILTDSVGEYVGYSYVDPVNPYTYAFEDDNRHGSHVSGIITTLTPTNVKVLPIKAFNNKGSASLGDLTLALERIMEIYCQSYNIVCVNLSLGATSLPSYTTMYNNLFRQLKEYGVLSVVSAGNEQLDTADVMPANCEEAITVTALKENSDGTYEFDHSYSNFGSDVDISAPGTLVYSAYHTADDLAVALSGTSMAAPHVSGAVAMLCLDGKYWQGSEPIYTADEIETRLYENTVDLGESGWDKFYGYGSLDLKYFNVDNQQDTLTFKDGNQVLDVSDYVEFEDSINLNVEASGSNWQIFYTTDGTIPTRNSTRYTSTINVTNSVIYYFKGIRIINDNTVACTKLYTVDLFNPNDDIDNFFVNYYGTLTKYTGHFKELEIPSVVDGMYVMYLDIRLFSDSELERITLPDTCIEVRDYAFSNCKNLTYIDLAETSSIKSFAFEGCTSLSDIDLTNVLHLGQKVNNIEANGHIFKDTTNLTSVYLPNVVSMGEDIFENSAVQMVAIGTAFEEYHNTPIKQDVTIYGYTGSSAQNYCDNFGNEFVPIDDTFSLTQNLPSSQEVTLGGNLSLSVSVIGFGLRYQWYETLYTVAEEGTALIGQTSSSLVIDTSYTGTKNYYVVITNWAGNVLTSNVCQVTVALEEADIVAQIYSQNSWQYFTSLESAILNSQADDVIVLVAGATISDFITIDNDLTIVASGEQSIIFTEELKNKSLSQGQALISVEDGVSLTLGLNAEIYQGISLGVLTVDGEDLARIDTLFELNNASLTLQSQTLVQLFKADKLVNGVGESNLTVTDSQISNNFAHFTSGEAYLFTAKTMSLSGTTFLNNYAQEGYLFYLANSSLSLSDASFENNTATYLISSFYDAVVVLDETTFLNNICSALIEFSVADNTTLNDYTNSLQLVESESNSNVNSLGEEALDVLITEKTGTNLVQNNCVIELSGLCGLSNFYINNLTVNPYFEIMSNLSDTNLYNINVLNSSAYFINNNPLVVVPSGITAIRENFSNDSYIFRPVYLSEQTSFYLAEDIKYSFNYVISQDNIVTQKYYPGEFVTKISDPELEGYDFLGWYQESTFENEYVFSTMPESDVTVYALFEVQTFTITASSSAGGVISPQGNVEVEYNQSQLFNFIANEGYYVTAIFIDGKALPEAELKLALTNGYTFNNVKEEHQISVEFAIFTFTITSSVDGVGGRISPSGERQYNYGQSAKYTILANTGYYLASVTVDNSEVDQTQLANIINNGYTFDKITQDHTIVVRFELYVFNIIASSSDNGQISPSGEVEVDYGQSQRFEFLPNNGYHVSSITIDGQELSGNDLSVAIMYGYTFNNVTQNHTISVTFLMSNFTITYVFNYNTDNVIQNYDYQEQINLLSPTRRGYNFDGWYLDENLSQPFEEELMPAENLTLYAKWEIKRYTITSSSLGQGTISPQGEISVAFNSSRTYTFEPYEGYKISCIKVDGENLPQSQLEQALTTGYTFNDVDGNHTIYVEFAIQTFSINITIEGNGDIISRQSLDNITYGEDRLFNITTDYDKYRIEIYIDDTLISEEERNTFIIEDIKKDLKVQVKFIEKSFFNTSGGLATIIVLASLVAISIIAGFVTKAVKRKRFYSN